MFMALVERLILKRGYMNLKKQLGKRIQELRLKNHLKQSELAEKVGVATKHQSCIETGKNYPSAELIEKYAKVFMVDVADILSIKHIEEKGELLSKINLMLKEANNDEIKMIYKFMSSIFY